MRVETKSDIIFGRVMLFVFIALCQKSQNQFRRVIQRDMTEKHKHFLRADKTIGMRQL